MKLQPRCTIYTAAPESWYSAQEYDMLVADVYSVGAVLLSMLWGRHPFTPSPFDDWIDPNVLHIFNKKDRVLLSQLVRPFSYRLKQVLLRILEPIPQNRITIQQFLADDWFTQTMEPQEREPRWESTLWKGIPSQNTQRFREV